MTKNIIIIFSIFLYFNQFVYSQKDGNFKVKIKAASIDTIEYIYLTAFNGHVFSKITEGKSNHLYKKGDGGYTSFFSKIDSSYRLSFTSNNFDLNSNDTIANVWWFLQKYDAPIYRQANFNHTFGKLSINFRNNIIKIKDVRNNKLNNFGTLLFKVIKISPYEIILEDLQNKEKNRRYYFVKKYL